MENRKMIYLVEDDESIRELVIYTLKSQGFEAKGFERPSHFWKALEKEKPALLLLDVMLPEEDGISILKKLRMRPDTRKLPIIMLTAKSSEYDKVLGLDSGADDYLVKPFSFQELEARIKALLRRSGNESVHMALRCGDLVLDPPSHRAIRNGQVIDLTVKEYRLLEYFIQNQGTALSRMNLLKNVWDKDFDTNTNVVDVYVNYLRTKIDKDFEPKLIHTVVGVGYMMEA